MRQRVLWVRHGESEANAGLPCADVWSAPLTAVGLEQAQAVAERIEERAGGRPRLIVHSCMARARQTAAATIAGFPDVPVEEWPVEEFTFLSGAAYAGTTQAQRDGGVRRYWERMDPGYCDGPGAESFAGFIARVDGVLMRLRRMDGPVCVFTHGRFIRGVLLRTGEAAGAPMEVLMRRALGMLTAVSVPNGVVWEMEMGEKGWMMGGAEVGHLMGA